MNGFFFFIGALVLLLGIWMGLGYVINLTVTCNKTGTQNKCYFEERSP